MENNYKQCKLGLWDSTIPGIYFDENGVSNYAKLFQMLIHEFPRGEQGKLEWDGILSQMRKNGKGKNYDCIIGVSGGTDSSYLMYLAKVVYNLRPLTVTFDNGWSSDIALKNIKKLTRELKIALETYVVDYEEMKDILRAYMYAGLPWIDIPTDLALRTILYRTAKREKIKYILVGNDFRSEGTQPNEWSHGDFLQIKQVHYQFGKEKLKSYPIMGLFEILYNTFISRIKIIRPFYYLEYQKKSAQKFLIDHYGWEYYGGHHHENIFTKFAISYWLKNKFNIDKRIITLSAQILSGEISREEGSKIISELPNNPNEINNEINYVIKKLDLSKNEFDKIWNSPNKSIYDYNSILSLIKKYKFIIVPVLCKINSGKKPMFITQLEERKIL